MERINRDSDGNLIFPDHPEFKPNLTPRQVLEMGVLVEHIIDQYTHL